MVLLVMHCVGIWILCRRKKKQFACWLDDGVMYKVFAEVKLIYASITLLARVVVCVYC